MSGEERSMDTVETSRVELTLGAAAEGSIDPASRSLNSETVENVERDVLSDRFDVPVIEGFFLPCGCIDGRCPHDEAPFNAVPNAAGGTLTLLVGELLTTGSNLAANAENSEEALASLIEYLQQQGYSEQIGGHTGPAHSAGESGCGANDKLAQIFDQIVRKSGTIHAVLQKLNITLDDVDFTGMIEKTQAYRDSKEFFVDGEAIAETLEAESPNGNCPALQGAHNEVLIRLNTHEGTTFDRRALKAAYGDEFQIFNVDVWALKKAAETLSYSKEEASEKFAAMVIYQVATALQLCGPSMRVIVR